MARVERFEENIAGRDFVVGDIHGCFDLLEHELEELGFDRFCDRAFAVGDLIDRGPMSRRALEWLGQPWFHTCIGNHEDMALSSAFEHSNLFWWVVANGGGWWLEQDETTQARYLRAFAELPLAMEVATQSGRLGIVHADVPQNLGWPEFVQALEAGDRDAREVALWGRGRGQGLVRHPVAGIDRVVCGHTIMEDNRVHIVGNVWLIDTGAFLRAKGSHLTVLPVQDVFAVDSPGPGGSTAAD